MGFNAGLREIMLVEYALIMFDQIFNLFFVWNFMGLNGISLNITLPMTPQFLSPARPPPAPRNVAAELLGGTATKSSGSPRLGRYQWYT
jgi:hypothetical protein